MSVAGIAQPIRTGLRAPVKWGLIVGTAQAATPLGFWWLDTATVYALGIAVIAAVYIGFAVADGRRTVLAVETSVAAMFLVIAAAAITGTPWLLVIGLAGHGLKDLWQHRTHFVANTLVAADFSLAKPRQVVIAGKMGSPETEALAAEVHRHFVPNKILLLADGGKGQEYLGGQNQALRAMSPVNGKSAAYVCENFTCKTPTSEPKEVASQLLSQRAGAGLT